MGKGTDPTSLACWLCWMTICAGLVVPLSRAGLAFVEQNVPGADARSKWKYLGKFSSYWTLPMGTFSVLAHI